ncbi:type II toxin-antitoxin system death-on-curing family toxin [uncultured Tateyamaria sp.]|uniref:type II toxin-antitoxin system death-on-curing family toxin n=1 Tax=uncultured Tateyamaria sp. TaxID=455651 RepID=UPI002605514B|nr:type II toxin-antitoxin system death-on-curing family toxin [uncultured Tateyamaria sp.]
MNSFKNSLAQELHYLYDRSIGDVSAFEEQLVATDLSATSVLRAHFAVVDYFLKEGSGEGVGGYGPKDIGLLLSALNRQFVGFDGESKWNTIPEKAATLLYGLVQNHPFHDANKRTAYLSTVHYLYQNNLTVTVTEKALEDMTVLVANSGLHKFPRFRDLQKKDSDPEVRFLAHYLRQNTRKIDRQQYFVTYRELDKILKRFDAWLENPHNNQINVMHWEIVEKKGGLFRKPTKTKEIRRACVLGFPGWTKQVGKGRIGHVRSALKLTPEYGIDSQSFFKDVDDMKVLIEMYEGALKRLAYR